jgi:transmembrane sensor
MKMDETTREEAAGWFAALRRGAMSVEERQSFDAWRADPRKQAALDSLHELWGEVSAIREFGVTAPHPHHDLRRLAAGVAAAAVLGGALAFAAFYPPGGHTLRTDVGEQRMANLPDGSVLGLNVVTKASYVVTAKKREVRLADGEAVFFVRKDSSRPFVVRAGDYEIRATGTAFNVRCRGGFVDVAVMDGSVLVRALSGPRAGQNIASLPAGERLRLGEAATLAALPDTTRVPVQNVAEWRLRILGYEDSSVAAVVEDLNRFYERPIEVADPALAQRRVTLRLQVEDRERTLRVLSDLVGADIERADDVDRLVASEKTSKSQVG